MFKSILSSSLLMLSLFVPYATFAMEQAPLAVVDFTFCRVQEKDVPLLRGWFKQPHVEHWWPTLNEGEDFFEEFIPRIRSKQTYPYLVLLNNKPMAYIQYYRLDQGNEKTGGTWLPEFPKNTLGIDQFIGEADCLGKGYGTEFIKKFIKYLAEALETTTSTIILDPEPENHAAIRCYEKVGFIKVNEALKTPYGVACLMRYDL